MNTIDRLTVNTMRTLTADAVQKANSGHPGLAIGAAPMALALFEQMKHNPHNPQWRSRDRFVLSAGHASMLEYSLLHLFGYDVSMDDIKNFRQLGSKTAGHPEYGRIGGIEATTGPLGQGFAMAVGMAIAERHMAAVFNRDGFNVVDNRTFVLMGDGCMMEGVSYEAASIAGNLKLNKLTALYDSNRITIEGCTDLTFTEDVASRFRSCGWNVLDVANGEDIDEIRKVFALARQSVEMPTLIIVHTKIAHGTPKEGSASSHGSPLGSDNIAQWKESIGWNYEPFTVPGEVRAHMDALKVGYAEAEKAYDRMIMDYSKAYPELYAQLNEWYEKELPDELISGDKLFEFEDKKLATRACSGQILNKLAASVHNLIGGSADLGPSNNTELKCSCFFSASTPEGRNIHFGIREFAMAAICNGLALYGGLRPYCATFLVFSDYLKPAARLSALMRLGVTYIFTHDSIGVGEDGPTHQPIEQVDMFRATPNTYVFRPADGRETAAAYLSALQLHAPSILVLSRQSLPQIDGTGRNALRGGYVLRESPLDSIDAILLATGSEVEPALKAQALLKEDGVGVRVVSMPCMELFDEQDAEYRESVLPSNVRCRIAVEALGGMSWYKYVGIDGEVISMKSFGASAPGNELFSYFGFTPENIATIVKKNQGKI